MHAIAWLREGRARRFDDCWVRVDWIVQSAPSEQPGDQIESRMHDDFHAEQELFLRKVQPSMSGKSGRGSLNVASPREQEQVVPWRACRADGVEPRSASLRLAFAVMGRGIKGMV